MKPEIREIDSEKFMKKIKRYVIIPATCLAILEAGYTIGVLKGSMDRKNIQIAEKIRYEKNGEQIYYPKDKRDKLSVEIGQILIDQHIDKPRKLVLINKYKKDYDSDDFLDAFSRMDFIDRNGVEYTYRALLDKLARDAGADSYREFQENPEAYMFGAGVKLLVDQIDPLGIRYIVDAAYKHATHKQRNWVLDRNGNLTKVWTKEEPWGWKRNPDGTFENILCPPEFQDYQVGGRIVKGYELTPRERALNVVTEDRAEEIYRKYQDEADRRETYRRFENDMHNLDRSIKSRVEYGINTGRRTIGGFIDDANRRNTDLQKRMQRDFNNAATQVDKAVKDFQKNLSNGINNLFKQLNKKK